MKARTRVVYGLGLLALLVLSPIGRALAQDNNSLAAAGLGAGLIMVFLVFAAACYVYMALALQTIADKTKTENSWLAWIPIANIVLMLSVAKKPIWWIILCFIPGVNLVILVIVWMAVAEARAKPSWWGILMIVPVANLITPGVLAWAD
jgi:magnesium-transporting ATPase (P-type)